MKAKLKELDRLLRDAGRVVVAYSGGVDSTFLLAAAHACLGDDALGVIGVSPSLARGELEEAKQVARRIGARCETIQVHEMDDPRYVANDARRCYYCKTALFRALTAHAGQHEYASVLDGSNADDAGDYRPGLQAAAEQGVRSPLREAGLTKAEIRAASRERGLPTWDKPASPCLASRVPYGTAVHPETLARIEQAEKLLRCLGLRDLRVRHHERVARIEVAPGDFPLVLEHRDEIVAGFGEAGYAYVTLDLAGFRSGSLNEALTAEAQRNAEREG